MGAEQCPPVSPTAHRPGLAAPPTPSSSVSSESQCSPGPAPLRTRLLSQAGGSAVVQLMDVFADDTASEVSRQIRLRSSVSDSRTAVLVDDSREGEESDMDDVEDASVVAIESK